MAASASSDAPSRVSDAGSFVADALTKAGVLDGDSSRAYGSLFRRFMSQHSAGTRKGPSASASLDWSKISPLSPASVTEYEALERPRDIDSDPSQREALDRELLNKIAILKLNGGLGTSMGCTGPKSGVHVKSGQTFLDLTVRQVEYLNQRYGVDVPLVLMNSFRTHEASVKLLNKYSGHAVSITAFTQSCFPRIDRDHYAPLPLVPFAVESQDKWYPPGHGDVYRALDRSGVLDSLLAAGKEVIFVSNVDNLGATVDLAIVYHMVVSEGLEFAMEVTDKTRGDVQGGTLIEYEGKAKLLEAAQVPAEHVADFMSLKTFVHFNTNNLWINLGAIKRLVSSDAIAPPVIVNERDIPGVGPVIELETAAGAAIEFFRKARGIRVPRSRFLPVKSTSDLLAVQSNLYDIRHGSLVQNAERDSKLPPIIKLGPEFSAIAAYAERLPFLPDIRFLDHLTVSGDVRFGPKVTLRGTVIIIASEGSRIDIPPGSVLENKVVTGNLRILEH